MEAPIEAALSAMSIKSATQRKNLRNKRTQYEDLGFSSDEDQDDVSDNSSDDADLYVRFHAVQLVIKLLARARRQTQSAVLNQPATVGCVLSLAEDKRDIVRNEVLLLLARLGEGCAGLQNILAFQGAFEQLLGIIESEGKEEGTRTM